MGCYGDFASDDFSRKKKRLRNSEKTSDTVSHTVENQESYGFSRKIVSSSSRVMEKTSDTVSQTVENQEKYVFSLKIITSRVRVKTSENVSQIVEIQEAAHYYHQRIHWEGMRKRIGALIKKLNPSNIGYISRELFSENLLRGRGLLCRSILKASVYSKNSIPVLASLVAVMNSKLPEIGVLLLTRIVLQFKHAYQQGDRLQFVPLAKFLSHLIKHGIVHGNLAAEIVMVLLNDPSEDNVETAVLFLLECGYWLQRFHPCALDVALETLEEVKKVRKEEKSQCFIEGLSMIKSNTFFGFQDYTQELDFIEIDEQVKHNVSYLHDLDPKMSLDVFMVDLQFVEKEKEYAVLRKALLEDYNVKFMNQNCEEGEYEEESGGEEDEEIQFCF